MKLQTKLPPSFALLLLLLGASCSSRDTVGNTIETENSVAIFVWKDDGTPAANVLTEIRPSWYVADTSHSAETSSLIQNLYTDNQGQIVCKGLPAGRYIAKAKGDSVGAVTEIEHLDTNSASETIKMSLTAYGRVKGVVDLPEGVAHAWVQIYGLENKVKTDSSGGFVLDSLPSGVYRVRAISKNNLSILAEDIIQSRSLTTMNAGTLAAPSVYAEDPSNWQYSRLISVDSLVSDWMRPLSNPTVVTLSLDSNNFNFSETMKDGRDLRILDEQGNLLSFQRVIWDVSAKRAMLRIRIETNDLDSDTQIELRWGRPGAIDPGFDGLWDGISDSLKSELYSVLVDDFEAKSIQTALPSPIPKSYWYLRASDSIVNLDSAIIKDFSKSIETAGMDREGSAVHISYSAPVGKNVLIGTVLCQVPRSLVMLDSVEFWVRGEGKFSFALENLDDVKGKAWIHDTLDSVWTRKSIKPSDFLDGDGIGGNVGWDKVVNSITNMSFFASEGSEFWLDDIRMYGINRDNLK